MERVSDKPNKFWDTERGRSYGYVIHETNGALALIHYATKRMQESAVKGRVLSSEELMKELAQILKGVNKIKEGIDYGYEKLKKLEGY